MTQLNNFLKNQHLASLKIPEFKRCSSRLNDLLFNVCADLQRTIFLHALMKQQLLYLIKCISSVKSNLITA